MRRIILGGVLGLAAYAVWQYSKGTALTQTIQLSDPRMYAAIAGGAVLLRIV